MGRTRKFTVDMYDTLADCTQSEGLEWLWTYIGWEMREAFGDTDLTEESDSYQKYLEGIVKINDYTKEKLHTIFENVKSVDRTYGDLLNRMNEEVEDYTTIVRRLRESIGSVNFVESFSGDTFLAGIEAEAQMMQMIRWREILQKDARDITAEEYMLLAAYLVRSGDAELLESMLIECYDYKSAGEYQNGYGLETTRVIFESPEKIEKLAAAMGQLVLIWEAAQRLDYTGEETQEAQFRAVQYATLLQKLAEYKELSLLSQESLTGDRCVLLESIFQISSDEKTGELIAEICPYHKEKSYSYCDYAVEMGNKLEISVSYPAIGDSAWAQMEGETFDYVRLYAGVDESVAEMVRNKLVSMGLELLPGAALENSKWQAVQDIAGIGVEVFENKWTSGKIEESLELTDRGLMCSIFQLAYVGLSVNGQVEQHEVHLHPSAETENRLEAFNRYMQSEEGKKAAEEIGYMNLPNGQMTLEYILENSDEVAGMIKSIDENAGIKSSFYAGINGKYGEIMDETK